MKKTSFIAARNVAEAGRLLKEHPQSVLMAGGTDLLVLKNLKLIAPGKIIFLKSIPGLGAIRMTKDGRAALGALVTLDEVARHPALRERFPMLSRAAAAVASPQIRNKATLGGNICLNSRCCFYNRSPFWRAEYPECRKASGGKKCYVLPRSRKGCFALQSGDTGGPLVALGAKLRLISAGGERVADVEDFYLGDGIRYLDLKAGEILTEILLPPPTGAAAFVKFRPQDNLDFATFTLAVIPPAGGTGARIVVGCAASRPLRARAAEKMLEAGAPAEEVARKTAEEVNLVSFVRGSADFKRQVIAAKMADVLAGLKGQPQ